MYCYRLPEAPASVFVACFFAAAVVYFYFPAESVVAGRYVFVAVLRLLAAYYSPFAVAAFAFGLAAVVAAFRFLFVLAAPILLRERPNLSVPAVAAVLLDAVFCPLFPGSLN